MYIKVRVRTDAKKESITETGEQRLDVAVREPAQQNRANRRVVQLVAEHYGVTPGNVRIISGQRSHTKMFAVNE